MSQTEQEKKRAVLSLTVRTLKSMLRFATTVQIQRYIIRRQEDDFRRFEMEAAAGIGSASIKGTGVLALRSDMETDARTFYHARMDVGPHEYAELIGSFPLSASAASYLFTMLEVFGDDVAAIVSPGTLNRNKAWHEDENGFADLRDQVQVTKAREGFAKHLSVLPNSVPELAARLMVGIKKKRNDYAHEGSQAISFDDYLRETLAVVCHIAFLITDEDRISVYPWEDYLDTFDPLTKG